MSSPRPRSLSEAGAKDVHVISYNAECTHPRIAWGCIKELVEGPGDPVLLVGAECLKATGPLPSECRKCTMLHMDHCFDLFAGPSIIEKCINNGAYIILPGWLRRSWRKHLEQWGLDHQLAGNFFRESVQNIVLLRTIAYEGMEKDLEEFTEFIGLSYNIIDVGLDRYRDLLNAALREARLNGQLVDAKSRLTAMEMAQADLAMAMEALRGISQLSDEDTIVQAVLEMHKVLFSPDDMRYQSVRGGVTDRIYTPLSPAEMPSEAGSSVWPTADERIHRCHWESERGPSLRTQ